MKPHDHKYQENITTELIDVRSTGKNFASHFGDRFKDYVGVYVCMCVYTCIHTYMCIHAIYTVFVFIVM